MSNYTNVGEACVGEAWNWCWELRVFPQFADKCDCWESFSGYEWLILLKKQPQFADKCDWIKLEDWHWDALQEIQPMLGNFVKENKDRYLMMRSVK